MSAVFLDRDGVIIENRETHITSWADVEFLPTAFEALHRLSLWAHTIVLVTNQSAVGRGLLSLEEAVALNRRVIAAIEAHGGRVDAWSLCPHHPVQRCAWRKPAPRMLRCAERDLALDLAQSYLVGDAVSDMEAARAAGVRGLLVLTGRGRHQAALLGRENAATCPVVPDLAGAVEHIAQAHQGERMSILVTGAAGYIGSVVTEQLIAQGHEVVALDDLRHGHAQAVHPAARFVQLDVLDGAGLAHVLRANPVDAVVHLAAEALIDESVRDPGRFFRVNVSGGLTLLDAMVAADVKRLVFSSTAAVYGEPERVPIPEEAPCRPVNAYGESKLAFERMLPWYRRAHGLRYVSLRYFNACGATERCGERHVPETHLIPVLFEAALGQRDAPRLYGTDYDTPDGTCIRDYIHVADIAQAHLLALAQIDELGARTYNMGNGAGYSNRQVIETVRQVTGRALPVLPAERRPGDPARLVAGAERIRAELGWVPRYPDLVTMVETAWQWRRHHPEGYPQ